VSPHDTSKSPLRSNEETFPRKEYNSSLSVKFN
jgi:hypothetical protein